MKDEPTLAPAHYYLGLAHLQNQNPAMAKSAIAEAIRLAPNALEPHLVLADVYIQSKAFDEAMREGQTVLKLQPKDPRGHLILAKVYLLKSDG